MKNYHQNLLHKELSYQVHGAAIEVRKDFGPGHKEKLYQSAFAEELKRIKVPFEKEKAIKVYSPKDGTYIGLYRPDFIIDGKIIVELKSEKFVNQDEIKRVYDYLRNGEYELAYLINFASQKLFVRRVIYTNDRKPFIKGILGAAKSVLVSIGLILVFFSGVDAYAATFFFHPSSGEFAVGDTFFLEVRLDTEGEEINAAGANVIFPKDFFEILDVESAGSFLTLWPRPPSFSNTEGTLSFEAGTPLGFNGRDGLVGRILIRVKNIEGSATISFEDATALLNDGKGTPAAVSSLGSFVNVTKLSGEGIPGFYSPSHMDQLKWYQKKTAVFHWDIEDGVGYSYLLSRDVFAEPDDIPDTPVGDIQYENLGDGIYYFHLRELNPPIGTNTKLMDTNKEEDLVGFSNNISGSSWVTWRVMIDATPPHAFEVLLIEGEEGIGGQKLLSFLTQDLMSGIYGYELCYPDEESAAPEDSGREENCRSVASPALLTKEDLKQDEIIIRAYDKAFNVSESRARLPESFPKSLKKLGTLAVAGGAAAMVVVIWKLMPIDRIRAFFRILFRGE